MTVEYSEAYHAACRAWVDEVLVPTKSFVGKLPGYRAPETSNSPDPRMNLTLRDMPDTGKYDMPFPLVKSKA